MICKHCQTDNPPAVFYCSGCGAPIPKKSNAVAVILLGLVGFAAVAVFVALVTDKPQTAQEAIARATPAPVATEKPQKITLAVYERLEMGMSYSAVVALIGPGREMGRNKAAGYETVLYQWDAGLLASVTLMFQNGKLIQRNQFGLR